MRAAFAAFATFVVLALTSSATSGDFATLNPLGFSPDGRVYAFEQHGVQDGSGFPYSEIFFLDLDEDRFIAPSPIRARLEDQGSSEDDARAEARRRAATLFDEHRPETTPGQTVAANPPTELSGDPHRIVFLPRAIEPSNDTPVEVRLDLLPAFDAPEHCTAFGHTPAGFRLTRTATEPGAAVRVLHEDSALPASRNCPYDYRMVEIRLFERGPDAMRAVAMIGVKSVGFEGPDMRYIAVPVPLD